MSLVWEKIPSFPCLCNYSGYVPHSLRICAISRLRCTFSESWDCAMHCLTVVWKRCKDGALPICWPLLSSIIPTLFAYFVACHPYILIHLWSFFAISPSFNLQLLFNISFLLKWRTERAKWLFDSGMFQSMFVYIIYIYNPWFLPYRLFCWHGSPWRFPDEPGVYWYASHISLHVWQKMTVPYSYLYHKRFLRPHTYQ